MITKGTFDICGSFKLTGSGLVIYGDVVEGIIKKDNFISFSNGQQEIKLKIKGVGFLDNLKEKIAKVSLTFYYDSEQQMELTQAMQVTKQIAKITEE